ncbi:two-component system sensor histidine kinase YesM [Hungatella effluvii]|uniref:Two-component system sensor histidine kinase YesM n=1 Tax=Hungatella effluvii TaxID=1096246 RepID=A0A2V3Y2C2_9FIRM|nr:sensor histidine kinase [Hungatella effluvii]PXX50914.1 two-component system sensor histidine kinase YesM [Hungatella effluvii]
MERYRDYPLQQKLVMALMVCIVIPLTVLGLFLNSYVAGNTRKKEYQINQTLVSQVAGDLDSLFTNIEELKYDCLTDFSLQDIITGKGNVTDYSSVGNWLDSIIRNEPCFHSICIADEGEVMIQRGTYLVSEEEARIRQAMEKVSGGFWTGPRQAKRVAGGGEEREDMVLSYYCGINNYEQIGKIEAAMIVNVDEEELSRRYSSFVTPQSLVTCLVDGEGTVLSSTDKTKMGSVLPVFNTVFEAWEQQGNGYVTAGYERERVVAFYVRSSVNDWYFINLVPRSAFLSGSRTSMLVIVCSFLLCIFFGITFALIQKRFVIGPIRKLVVKIDRVETGNFTEECSVYPGDEIGALNREFDEMSRRLKRLIEEVYTTKIKEQEAELNALIAQINPHFLYNTLDSIHWLAVKNRDYAVGEQLEALSAIFRHVLNRGEECVTIASEVEFIQNYMAIMESRFGRRVKIQIQAEPGLEQVLIPKLIIQPLVENGILHGLEPKKEGGTILITIEVQGDNLVIAVEDDGVGADEAEITEKMKNRESGKDTFALKNIDDRIKLRYGSAYGLYFESKPGKGTRVLVMMPLEQSC